MEITMYIWIISGYNLWFRKRISRADFFIEQKSFYAAARAFNRARAHVCIIIYGCDEYKHSARETRTLLTLDEYSLNKVSRINLKQSSFPQQRYRHARIVLDDC